VEVRPVPLGEHAERDREVLGALGPPGRDGPGVPETRVDHHSSMIDL
jgi:hypothetical protein